MASGISSIVNFCTVYCQTSDWILPAARKLPMKSRLAHNRAQLPPMRIFSYVCALAPSMESASAEIALGNADPANDKDWENYVNSLKGAGLDRYLEILKAADDATNG